MHPDVGRPRAVAGDPNVRDHHPGLLEPHDWLAANEVTVVGMEATGSYWKPVYYMLEEGF